MKQAVIYARVSSKDQEREGFSIPAQLKLLREYALKHGFHIVSRIYRRGNGEVCGPQAIWGDGAFL